MRRNSCSSLSMFLSTRSSRSTSPTSPTSLSQDCEFFIMCPATIRCETMSEQAQGDLLQTQSQDDQQAQGNPLPPELPWGKVEQEKNSHSLPERPKLRNAGRPEQLGLYARDAQVKPYLEQQILGELITAEQSKLRLVNRETITDTLSWDKIWQLEDPWWNKTSWSRLGSHKSFTLTIPGIWH